MKVNKADLLKTLKQDLSSAKDMKAALDTRVSERRDVYSGKLYGNEEEGKSKIESGSVANAIAASMSITSNMLSASSAMSMVCMPERPLVCIVELS